MSQPNFTYIDYDMQYFYVPKYVHHKKSLRRLRLDFNLSKISFLFMWTNDWIKYLYKLNNSAYISINLSISYIIRKNPSTSWHNHKHKDYQKNAHFYIWSKNLSKANFSRFFSFFLVDYIIIHHNYLNNVSYSSYSNLQCLSNLKPNYPFKLGVIYLTYYEMLSKICTLL